jgi:hypothetical protein
MVYLGVGIVLYLALDFVGASSVLVFVVLAGIIISFYGGGFATVPAYLRDLFGTYQVGAIHGRLLTAWAAAGVAGPLIVNGILDTQGEPGNLTAGDYRPALLTMVGVLVVGFVANLLIRPVDERHHQPDRKSGTADAGDDAEGSPNGREHSAALLPVAWALVGIPLAYGVYQTAIKAVDLFG